MTCFVLDAGLGLILCAVLLGIISLCLIILVGLAQVWRKP